MSELTIEKEVLYQTTTVVKFKLVKDELMFLGDLNLPADNIVIPEIKQRLDEAIIYETDE